MKETLASLSEKNWVKALTWLIRILVGSLFIFSGFAKCIDPYGTFYKMMDYVGVLGLSFVTDGLVISAAFGLSILEFLTGVFLATGCFRRFTPILLSIIMLFMLPLTLWILLKNPVSDCGCFGDAYIISNAATFWKNVAISIGAVWLLCFNRTTGWLIRPYMQWMAVVASGSYAAALCYIGYSYQPLLDFRPFPEGSKLYSAENISNEESEPEFVFIYEKDGRQQEFSEDNLPDENDGWVFVDRKEIQKSGVANNMVATSGAAGFVLWDEKEDIDVTEDVLGDNERRVLILFPTLSDTSLAASYTINSMHSWAIDHDIDFAAIVGATTEEIEKWKDLSMPDYPIYRAEDTSIKEIARGNPAVVYLENGVIIWKRTLSSLPTQDFLDEDTPQSAMDFQIDNKRILLNISLLYIAVMCMLSAFSFIPVLNSLIMQTRPSKGKGRSESGGPEV